MSKDAPQSQRGRYFYVTYAGTVKDGGWLRIITMEPLPPQVVEELSAMDSIEANSFAVTEDRELPSRRHPQLPSKLVVVTSFAVKPAGRHRDLLLGEFRRVGQVNRILHRHGYLYLAPEAFLKRA